MLATVMYAPGDVRMEQRPEPRIEQSTDAIVRIVRTCVCGSDLHPYHSITPTETGATMGHELIGVVEEVGSDVRRLRPGDFVIAPFAFSDGTCDYCREGLQTSCVHGGFLSANQAEAARIPQADGTLVKAPATEDPALLASLLTLSDVFLTGHHAAVCAGVAPGVRSP